MPTDWTREAGLPGVFDSLVFDEVVFDACFSQQPEEALTGSWTTEAPTTGNWIKESAT